MCPLPGNCQKVGLGMKRTKKITKVLLAISKTLPKQKYQYLGKLTEKGADLIQKGIMEDGDKRPIFPHKEYVKSIPLEREVNHFNRLKSAYDSGGKKGVKAYLKKLLKPEMEAEFFSKLDLVL